MSEASLSSLIGIGADGKSLNWRAYLALVLLCLCFYVPGLATLPPTDRDESLFAQATKQMVETKDYVDINFLQTPRYKKPVGIYWLQAASVKLFNPDRLNEIWAYRLPSMLGAIIAVLMTAAIGTLLFGGKAGLTAGVMLASCLDLDIEAHIAKTDAALLAAVMLAQYGLARAYMRPEAGWGSAFIFWTAMGAGILLKGPIILLTVLSTLLWLRFTEKNLAWFRRLKPIAGFVYLMALISPWFIAINLASHGQFAAQAGGHDFLGKLWQGQDRGFLPPGLHALIFPAMFFPFSVFAVLAMPDAWARRTEPAIRFCLGWIVPTWIVFEISLTKLPHYVLPAYPAIALLTAKIFLDGYPKLTTGIKRWYPVAMVSLWNIVGMVFAVGLAALPYIIDRTIDPLQIVASGIFLAAIGTGLLFYLQHKKLASVIVLTIGMMIFSGTAFSSTLPGLKKLWMAREIVREARSIAPCPNLEIVSAGYEEPSLAFLAGTKTKLVPNGTYAASEMQADLCRVGVINKPLLKSFLTSSPDNDTQPTPAGHVAEGLRGGNGAAMELYFYVMPQSRKEDPVYP